MGKVLMEMSENELEYQTAVISEVNVWLFQVNEALEKKIRFFFFFFFLRHYGWGFYYAIMSIFTLVTSRLHDCASPEKCDSMR